MVVSDAIVYGDKDFFLKFDGIFHNAQVDFMALFVQWNPLRDMSRYGGGKAEGNWISIYIASNL